MSGRFPRQKEGIFHSSEEEDHEEGEIVSSEYPPSKYQSRISKSEPQEEPYDSSEDNEEMLANQKRRREQMLRERQEQVIKMAGFSQEQLLTKAFEDVQKTNMRVLAMRKKNERRMQDVEKVRVTQQPYLVSNNTHFRGNISEYPLLTQDKTNRTLYHPNYSLRVGEMKLGEFVQKNIKQQTTANYLNQVVKFENYAYQQRKKRRHHIQ